MKNFLFILILFFITSLTSCTLENINEADLFVNEQQLNNAFTTLSNVEGMKSIIISKNDTIVKEQYFNSSGPNVTYDVRSVTKTVTSLLIGIAIDKDYIPSVEDEIGQYIARLLGKFLLINHSLKSSTF